MLLNSKYTSTQKSSTVFFWFSFYLLEGISSKDDIPTFLTMDVLWSTCGSIQYVKERNFFTSNRDGGTSLSSIITDFLWFRFEIPTLEGLWISFWSPIQHELHSQGSKFLEMVFYSSILLISTSGPQPFGNRQRQLANTRVVLPNCFSVNPYLESGFPE